MPEFVACCIVLHNLALLNGDFIEPEDEEDHDDDPLNPTTLKQEWKNNAVSAGRTFVCLFSMSTTTCNRVNILQFMLSASHFLPNFIVYVYNSMLLWGI